jgi:hypothetical protein
MPMAAISMTILNGAAFDPRAEFRKLTASLLTPTIRSEMANKNRTATIIM